MRTAWVDQAAELWEIGRSLAELGRACTQKVADWLEAGGPGHVRSIGKLRSMVREMLAEELEAIDRLVEPHFVVGEALGPPAFVLRTKC